MCARGFSSRARWPVQAARPEEKAKLDPERYALCARTSCTTENGKNMIKQTLIYHTCAHNIASMCKHAKHAYVPNHCSRPTKLAKEWPKSIG